MTAEEGSVEPRRGRGRLLALAAVAIVVILVVGAFSLQNLNSGSGSGNLTSVQQKSLSSAMTYLLSSFNPTADLISNAPNSTTFWLFPDNYLSSLAFHRYSPVNQTYSALAEILNLTIVSFETSVPSQNLLDQYTALNSTLTSFDCPNDYTLGWSGASNGVPLDGGNSYRIMTVLNNGDPACAGGGQAAAEVAFLQAVYYHRLGDSTQAADWYREGSGTFDGNGVSDSSNSTGRYQTYKLALYIYAAACLGEQSTDANFPKLLPVLLEHQDNSTGGFYPTYGPSGQGASTDTFTTTLAALALEAVGSPSVC